MVAVAPHPPPLPVADGPIRPDPNTAEAFLRLLYGESPEELPGSVGLFTVADRACAWFPAGDLRAVAEQACRLAETDSAYFHVALHDPTQTGPRGPIKRGTIKSARVLPGLFFEIDVKGPAHAATELPADAGVALAYLQEVFPLPPTAVVGSGHGLHVYWLFAEPWVLEDEDERERAGALLWRLLGTLRERWHRRGWVLDPVAELSRLLRLPGTVNRKRNLPPAAVRLLEAAPAQRYHPDDFEPYLLDEEYLPRPQRASAGSGAGDFPAAAIEPIVARCAFMRHVRDDARRLPEPHWYAGLGILGRCADGEKDGEALAHEWSQPYPDYSHQETAEKLAHALDHGPRTCATIHQQLGFTECRACPHFQKITSPIVLGTPRPPVIDLGRRSNGAADGHPSPPRGDAGPAGGGKPPRHEIDAGNLDLPDVAEQAWEALLDYNRPPRLFRYGEALSRLEPNDRGGMVTRALTEDRTRHHLARAASWYRWKRDGREGAGQRVPELPPMHVVKDLLATPDPPLPALTRVVAAPVFAPTGEVLTTPGYHEASRTYYAPLPGATAVPSVPDAPTGGDVAHAKALLLEELLVDFPFTGESERAHAVALLLLPFLRGMIDGPTPLHLIEKPTIGTGATLLAEVLTSPAAGAKPAPMVEGRDDEEWRKRITATLRESPAAVLIDNLRRKLDTAALSVAITAPDTWADRLLGTSETVHLPVRCAWIATGNNPALSDEMARRAVRIRLDARVEQPHLREPQAFKHADLGGWAATHRHELVWAALVLGRAWVAAGRPPGQRTIGSFESWARVVGGVLETAGIPGFLGNLRELYERSNEERVAWVAFVGAWWDAFEGAPTLVKDLYPLVADGDIPLALGDPEKRNSGPVTLGTKIRQAEGRIFDGKRIERAGERKNAILWRLQPLGAPGAAPDAETPRDSPGDSPPGTARPHLGDTPRGESGESDESFPDPRTPAPPQAQVRARPEGQEQTPPDSPSGHGPGGERGVSLGGVSPEPGGETPRGDSPPRGKCDYCGRPMYALREVHGQVHVLCQKHDFTPAGGTR